MRNQDETMREISYEIRESGKIPLNAKLEAAKHPLEDDFKKIEGELAILEKNTIDSLLEAYGRDRAWMGRNHDEIDLDEIDLEDLIDLLESEKRGKK